MIPRTVHFGKDHIPTSLPKLQPVSNTAWRKKDEFDQLASTIYGLLKLQSVADLSPLIAYKVPIKTFTTQQEATKVMYKVQRCVLNVNHIQAVVFLNTSGKTVNVKSDKLNEIPGRITFFRFSREINSVDIDPCIRQKKIDLQLCLCFPQHNYNVTTRVADTLSSAHKHIKTPDMGKGSMADFLGGSWTIRTGINAAPLNNKSDVLHQHK